MRRARHDCVHKHLDSHLRIHCIQNNGYIQYRNSLNFRCKNIFVCRKHTKLFYSKSLLQRIFFGQIFRAKHVRVCSACSFRDSGSWKAMAGRMSIRRYLKPIDGLPDPKGSLSTTIPSAAIAYANREDRHLAEFGGHTPRYCTAYRRGNLSHSKPSPPLSC